MKHHKKDIDTKVEDLVSNTKAFITTQYERQDRVDQLTNEFDERLTHVEQTTTSTQDFENSKREVKKELEELQRKLAEQRENFLSFKNKKVIYIEIVRYN
jgi:hypothetical protein